MKNTGKSFETLTQAVFAQLHSQEGICTDIKHDQTLQGKSGTTHQIDVMFTVRLGGIDYLTVVQCKDWGSAVKQEQVFAFKSVLDDLAGQPRGIIVARSGFQHGAREFADHHGIKLYELRPPRDEDWKGLIRKFSIEMIIRLPQFDDIQFDWDDEYNKAQLAKTNLKRIDYELHLGGPGVFVFNTIAGGSRDLNKVFNALTSDVPTAGGRASHSFDDSVLIPTEHQQVPFVAAKGVSVSISFAEDRSKFTVSLDHFIAYCFRDVLDQKSRFLDAAGASVHKAEK
jgi:hypothetical protein